MGMGMLGGYAQQGLSVYIFASLYVLWPMTSLIPCPLSLFCSKFVVANPFDR